MAITLRWKSTTGLPIEADGLRPDALGSLSAAEVARLPIPVGNGLAGLGDLFRVEGDGADGRLILEGDLRRVGRVGMGMASGLLTIRGDVGPMLGAGMSGGTIEVDGSAGDWAGAELLGGLVRIRGSAGHHLGSAFPGSRRGMRAGAILVGGSTGEEAGLAMRRGVIAIGGRAGCGLGRAMIAGSIFAFGPIGPRPGAGMKRGTLALFGLDRPEVPGLLPTFRPACRARPPFVTIYLRQLLTWGFPVPDAAFAGPFDRYNGDLADRGQGEVLAWAPRPE